MSREERLSRLESILQPASPAPRPPQASVPDAAAIAAWQEASGEPDADLAARCLAAGIDPIAWKDFCEDHRKLTADSDSAATL